MLAEHCAEYRNLHDQMIRDRTVVGLKDSILSPIKLQMVPELTLKKAQDIVRSTDAVRKQHN